jgi:hypothetical protein
MNSSLFLNLLVQGFWRPAVVFHGSDIGDAPFKDIFPWQLLPLNVYQQV